MDPIFKRALVIVLTSAGPCSGSLVGAPGWFSASRSSSRNRLTVSGSVCVVNGVPKL